MQSLVVALSSALSVALLLATPGCAQLRYDSHTEMVALAGAPPPPPPRQMDPDQPTQPPRRRHSRSLVIGGAALSLIGAGLMIGSVAGERAAQANVQLCINWDIVCSIFGAVGFGAGFAFGLGGIALFVTSAGNAHTYDR